jgi:hypothetical protein
MNPQTSNPLHLAETEFQGELQVFSGPALEPDDPSLETRERTGRPESSRRNLDNETE